MTATNHAITGATIGLLVANPLLALPAAFLSHYVCDGIPHFDPPGDNNKWLKSNAFKRYLMFDAFLCLVLVAIIFSIRPHDWFVVCVCAFLATSPDLFWINRYIKLRKHKKWRPSLISKIGAKVQWYTGPLGAIVELTWLVSGIYVLSILLH